MTPVEREFVRFRALGILRAASAAVGLAGHRASLDDLIMEDERLADPRAETAAVIAIAQVLHARGLSWSEFFTPVADLGVAAAREILVEADRVLRKA